MAKQKKEKRHLSHPRTCNDENFLSLCFRFAQLLQINDIKIEGSHMSHAFLARMSANAGVVADGIAGSKENKRAMRKSLRVHYACDICSFLCRTKGSLRKHAQLHRNTCRICGERFVAIDKLEIHMVLNHGEAKYSCQLCYTVTWSVPDMTEHFSARHLDPSHNNCSICNKEYRSKIGIQRHMYKHHCSVSVACTICRRIYKSVSALKTHTRLVHLKSGYQCGICKRRVATAASLEAHMRRHENTGQPTNPETYVCTTCGESFLNKRDLKSHVVSHGRIKPHVCPVCRKAFEERRVQVQHILTHMNTPLYVCDVCGMKYSRRATLVRHRSTHPGPLGALPEIPVTDIVTEFVKNYLNESKNMPNS